MNAILKQMLETGYATSPTGEKVKLETHITPEEGHFLHRLVSELRPRTSLEVGLAFGVSALFICDALERTPQTRHIVIDPGQTGDFYKSIGLNNLKAAGYEDLIQFHSAPSQATLPQLVREGCKVDFAFIDGFHTFDHALVDFFYVDQMLRVGGIVVMDDANWPSVRRLCRFIAINRAYRVHRCLEPATILQSTWKGRLLRSLARRMAPLRSILKPESLEPDEDWGIVRGSRCVAFQKMADDTRHWEFHREF
ncbi:MAG: class I SAM-dependent methyltransferase [Verrucomicrobia bacterium]|nr:class I SAM-dependent methyltransferase [Verrucomicrobiota bacterium]